MRGGVFVGGGRAGAGAGGSGGGSHPPGGYDPPGRSRTTATTTTASATTTTTAAAVGRGRGRGVTTAGRLVNHDQVSQTTPVKPHHKTQAKAQCINHNPPAIITAFFNITLTTTFSI